MIQKYQVTDVGISHHALVFYFLLFAHSIQMMLEDREMFAALSPPATTIPGTY